MRRLPFILIDYCIGGLIGWQGFMNPGGSGWMAFSGGREAGVRAGQKKWWR
jgi:hypothetical protein